MVEDKDIKNLIPEVLSGTTPRNVAEASRLHS